MLRESARKSLRILKIIYAFRQNVTMGVELLWDNVSIVPNCEKTLDKKEQIW